jgi:hypothetical protein
MSNKQHAFQRKEEAWLLVLVLAKESTIRSQALLLLPAKSVSTTANR